MTRSFFATSASSALSSVTSREIGVAFLTPAESFLALSRVLQARERLAGGWDGNWGFLFLTYRQILGYRLH